MNRDWEDIKYIEDQLFEAKQALFSARSVREVKFLQNKIKFLSDKIRELGRV
jgi:hypothetical protein